MRAMCVRMKAQESARDRPQSDLRSAINCWCERGDSNPHGFTRQILSLQPATDSKQDQQGNSVDRGKVLQNPQLPRNKTQDNGKE
jgi:hypothetical protein